MAIQNIGRNHWRVTAAVKDPLTGHTLKHISRRFHGTKADAVAYLKELECAPSDKTSTLHSYLTDMWMPSLKVEANTLEYYRRGINDLSPIGGVRLGKLTAYNIETCLHSLPPGSVRRRAKKVLSASLNTAVRWGLLNDSPLRKADITLGTGGNRSVDAYSVDEVSRLLRAVCGHVSEPVVLVMVFAGLRKEEALALSWEDISTIGEITVNKAWTFSGKAELKTTKTYDSMRTAYISGYGLDRLNELRKTGAIWRGKAGYVNPRSAYRTFKALLKRHELRYIPLNNLRHTFATISLASGVDVAIVSRSLGHARVSTTVNAYVKPLDAAKRQASKTFADVIKPCNLQESYNDMVQTGANSEKDTKKAM